MNLSEEKRERVRIDELGLYIKTITIDYGTMSTQEMADLITHYFNVICLPEDIEEYVNLRQPQIDYELEDRREEYFQSINRINPYL
jgi:hypothetical protein